MRANALFSSSGRYRFGFLLATVVAVWTAPSAAAVLPDFAAATFVAGAPINNVYFPLIDRRSHLFQAFAPDGTPVDEQFELRVLGTPGPTILGVQSTIRQDRAFEDGLLVEKTFDYYAQDTAGNVWYLGEDVTNYVYDPDGNLIGTNNSSAWRAGVNGGLPGYASPVDLTLGFNYFQEFAAIDGALDEGTTFATDAAFDTIIGPVSNVLQVLETSTIDPALREFKYYAPGFGLIRADEGLDATLQNPGLVLRLVEIGNVPEPSTWAMMIAGFGLVGGAVRRQRAAMTSRRIA